MTEETEKIEIDTSKKRDGFEEAYKAMLNSSEYKSEYMFYAFLVSRCKVVFDYNMPAPAGVNFMVNSYNLYINPTEFNKWPLVHRLGVLKHEMLHILNNHVGRLEERNHKVNNIAADAAINQFINRQHLPEGCIYPDVLEKAMKEQGKNIKFPEKLTTEMYHELLKDNMPKDKKSGSGDSSGLKPIDDHRKWKESKGDAELRKNITRKMLEESMQKTSKQRGNMPADLDKYIDMFSNKAIVSWKKVLKNLTGNKRVNSVQTIMRKSRRFPDRADLRGKVKDRLFTVVCCVDISGSMDDKEVLKGLTEIHEICKVTKSDMKLIQIDTVIKEVSDFSKNTKLFNRQGCGGTYMGAGMTYIHENRVENDLVILISDCEIEDISTWEHPPKRLIVLNTTRGTKCPGIDHYGSRYREFNLQDEA